MRIDAHQHFWKYNKVRDAWIEEGMEILMRDYLPSDLAPYLKSAGLDGCVAVQSDSSENDLDFLLGLAAGAPIVKAIVGWIDLKNPNLETRLDYWAQKPLVKGFRHVLEAEPDSFFPDPAFHAGLDKLAERSYTYDLLVSAAQLELAAGLTERHAELAIVLDHLGKPRMDSWKPGDAGFQSWSRSIRRMAACRNVYCKVSGMVTEANLMSWDAAEIKPWFDVVLEAFGPGRLIYGSDWPVCLRAAGYHRVFGLAESLLAECSQAEKDGIYGLNAARFYKIG